MPPSWWVKNDIPSAMNGRDVSITSIDFDLALVVRPVEAEMGTRAYLGCKMSSTISFADNSMSNFNSLPDDSYCLIVNCGSHTLRR